jgi:hypothetical protein
MADLTSHDQRDAPTGVPVFADFTSTISPP